MKLTLILCTLHQTLCNLKPVLISSNLFLFIKSLESSSPLYSLLLLLIYKEIHKNIKNRTSFLQTIIAIWNMNSTIASKDGRVSGGSAEFLQTRLNHIHDPKENQCSSVLIKHIKAPVHLVSLCFFMQFFHQELQTYKDSALMIIRFGL